MAFYPLKEEIKQKKTADRIFLEQELISLKKATYNFITDIECLEYAELGGIKDLKSYKALSLLAKKGVYSHECRPREISFTIKLDDE